MLKAAKCLQGAGLASQVQATDLLAGGDRCDSCDPGASGQVQASKGVNEDQQAQGLLLLLLLLRRFCRFSRSLLDDDADVSGQMLQAAALVIEVREP